MMRRTWLLPLAVLLGLAPLAIRWLAAGPGHGQASAVYTVAQVRDHLARDRAAWVGRTVRIRALAEPCPARGNPYGPMGCPRPQPDLADPEGADLADPLPLVVGSGSPLLAALRRLPLVGGWVPPLPAPPWEVLHTYQVRLQAAPGGSCGVALCFEAVLLDAAPGALGME
jgi:hypothetical protein